MAEQPGRYHRSPIVGSLRLPAGPPAPGRGVDDDEPVPVLLELNLSYPGGLLAVRGALFALWSGLTPATDPAPTADPAPATDPATAWDGAGRGDASAPEGLRAVSPKLYRCVITRSQLHDLVARDAAGDGPPSIFRAWPDYTLEPHIDRSAATVTADAARRAYRADGEGIVWAVVDSGIDGRHPHFAGLGLGAEARGAPAPAGAATGLHRDFSDLVHVGRAPGPLPVPAPPGVPITMPAAVLSALTDESGHGTHVAGIIAGRAPNGATVNVAQSGEPVGDGGYVPRAHGRPLEGMAPRCELVSLKVMRRSPQGTWITSSSAVIRALTYLRTEVNVDPGLLRVHGVNLSLGCGWDPADYAAGESPLSQAINQLVASGVVVVVSAGNAGARSDAADGTGSYAVLGSITEPAHAQDCIAVGSTHRDAPHTFGVTWTSSKGPTLDGRRKPDLVAPGEWIASAATGEVRAAAGFPPPARPGSAPNASAEEASVGEPSVGEAASGEAPVGERPAEEADYAELSGTSMAAPHVSGVIAGFLSARPEFIGRPHEVKALATRTATDLGREPLAQGAGLIDEMRMLSAG